MRHTKRCHSHVAGSSSAAKLVAYSLSSKFAHLFLRTVRLYIACGTCVNVGTPRTNTFLLIVSGWALRSLTLRDCHSLPP